MKMKDKRELENELFHIKIMLSQFEGYFETNCKQHPKSKLLKQLLEYYYKIKKSNNVKLY